MTAKTLARRLAGRFGGRPHVGAVTHFDGLDVPAMVERLHAVARELGLRLEGAIEDEQGRRVFNATAPVPAADGLELWVIASEQPSVGCKVEARVFHAIEQSAVADEYLAAFAHRLAGGPPEDSGSGDDAS